MSAAVRSPCQLASGFGTNESSEDAEARLQAQEAEHGQDGGEDGEPPGHDPHARGELLTYVGEPSIDAVQSVVQVRLDTSTLMAPRCNWACAGSRVSIRTRERRGLERSQTEGTAGAVS